MRIKRLSIYLLSFTLCLALTSCGADSFLQNSARVHSLTKSARQILENIYDDKLASRETVLEIARPLQRFQAKQVEVFETWKKHRDPVTGEVTLTPEVAADFAAILVSLKSDFGAFKTKSSTQAGLSSPAIAMLQPALKVLESEFNGWAGQLADIKGVSKRGGIFRLLKAQNDAFERLYADVKAESQEVEAWIN